MKLILSLAALAAVVIAFQNANAVEEPPEPRVQLVEVEQQTPYLESFNSITAGTATQSAIRRVGNTGGVVFSSQAYALFDNQNPDGSRATFPLEVEDAGTYGLRAQFVKGPDMGVVQVAVDGRPLGAPIDLYAAALQTATPVALGVLALSEGKHMFTLTVTGKHEASSNYRAGIDLLVLDTQAAPQPTPTAVATAEVGRHRPADAGADGRTGVVRRLPARRRARVHGGLGGQRRVECRRRRADGVGARPARERVAHARPAADAWTSRPRPGTSRCPTRRRRSRSSRRSAPRNRCAPAATAGR